MGAVLQVARSQLRRRWPTTLLLTVVIAALAGASMSLVAGARRSASVVDRYFDSGIQYDVSIFAPTLTADDLLAIPGVTRVDIDSYIGAAVLAPDGSNLGGVNTVAMEFDSIDATIRLVAGSWPDAGDDRAVVVNEAFTEAFGLDAGERFDLRMFDIDQLDDMVEGVYEPFGPTYGFDIAAVARSPFDVAVDEIEAPERGAYVDAAMLIVTSSFYEQHRGEFLDFGAAYDVVLDDRLDSTGFAMAVDEIVVEDDQIHIGPGRFSERRDILDSPVDVETAALLFLGMVAAVAGAVTVGVLMRVERRSHEAESSTLRQLGFTTRGLGLVAVVRALPAVVVGTAAAVGIAAVMSASFPIGLGGELEPDPGVRVDAVVVTVGAALTCIVIVLACVVGAAPARPARPRSRTGAVGTGLTSTALPADVSLGAHVAIGGRRGLGAQTARGLIAIGALAVAAVTALAIVDRGVERVYEVPEARGWVWDAIVGNTNFTMSDTTLEGLADETSITAQSRASYGQVAVSGVPVEVLAHDPRGTAPPQILSGRLPAGPDEIAVGERLADRLGLDVGDRVTFSVAGGDLDRGTATRLIEQTVVGTAVVPTLAEADLGESAVVTLDAVAASGGDASPRLVLAQLGGDEQAVLALVAAYTAEVVTDIRPARIASLQRVRTLLTAGVALAAALGAVVAVYAIAAQVRARRHDLVVMRALGLTPGRLRRVLVIVGVMFSTAMLVIGIPLGIGAGSLLWTRMAEELSVGAHRTIPVALVLLLPLALLLSVAAALSAAGAVRRANVAVDLRAE